MLENLIWTAIGGALVAGVFMGPRSPAWPLVASALAGQLLDGHGVLNPFLPGFAVDLSVAAIILSQRGWRFRNLETPDWLIGAFFPVAWACWFAGYPLRYYGTASVVICQLLLTIPLPRIQWGSNEYSHGKLREAAHGRL